MLRLLPNSGYPLVRILVMHDSRTGDDAQPARLQAADLGDHLLCQSLTEIVLRRIVAQVLEWQDNQLDLSRQSFCELLGCMIGELLGSHLI